MPQYVVRFHTQIEVAVTIEAADADEAADAAWQYAEDFAQAVHTGPSVRADMTFDGIGASSVEPKPAT